MKFQEQLIRLRKEKGLSQEALGEMLGVSRQAISKWELGTSQPEMSNIEKLCEIFEVSPNVLLGYEEKNSVKAEAETSTFPKERKKKGLAFLLLIVILNIGLIMIVLSGGLGNNKEDNRTAVDSFEVTGFYFGEVASYHTGDMCNVKLYFTPSAIDEDLSYEVVANRRGIINSYEAVSKNGIYEAEIRLEGETKVSIKCDNGKESKTILLLNARVWNREIKYEEL